MVFFFFSLEDLSSASALPSFEAFYNKLYRHQERVFELLSERTSMMTPLLVKVEEILVASRTMRSPRLGTYYLHWETKLFAAIGNI